MTALEIRPLHAGSDREELIEALLAVNKEARRTLAKDGVGRPNQQWADRHAFLNTLLDMLEAADG